MHTRHQHLIRASIDALRPTQMTVGYAEVQQKRQLWKGMKKAERDRFLSHHWFPAVEGPKNDLYIVDHHHLGRALLEEGVKDCQVVLLKNLDQLDRPEFWVVMDHHQWVHPYDAKGKRQDVSKLPNSLKGLVDDPYRSLAGEVRRAGGFPKDATPFAEFLWADFFRHRVPLKRLQADPAAALARALVLCHSPAAAHLPGWSGAAPALAD